MPTRAYNRPPGTRRGDGADRAACTRLVFDDHGSFQVRGKLIAEDARDGIRAAAGPVPDDNLYRLRGVALGHSGGRERGCGRQHGYHGWNGKSSHFCS